MLLATAAGPAYYRMYSTDVPDAANQAVAPKETSPHFFVSGIGRKKTGDAAKICGAENIVNENPTNIRKWIARFYCLGIYTPLEARVCCSQ